MLVGIGVLIAGLCGACTLAVLNDQADVYHMMFVELAPVVGGIPIMVGVAIVVFGCSVYLRGTPGRVRLAAKLRDVAVGIVRIGFGAPFIWLSGLTAITAIWSRDEGGGFRAIDSEGVGEIGLAIIFLVPGIWLLVMGFRRVFRAK